MVRFLGILWKLSYLMENIRKPDIRFLPALSFLEISHA